MGKCYGRNHNLVAIRVKIYALTNEISKILDTMRISRFPLHTVKETPADAEVASHQLMLRAGMIRKLSAGLYTWLPIGLRVLRKVSAVIRQQMDASGAIEIMMPAIQPASLWQESGRWDAYGPELLRIKDRHDNDFVFGPTHEEVITDLARKALQSHRQLPVNYYQIQTKFRDEIRPRFGAMRAREFTMKDAYSFHLDEACLEQTYQLMYQTYSKIFQQLGLEFRAVLADTGSIGGNTSHEFHVLAESGEDAIAFSDRDDYAANVELAPTTPGQSRLPATESLQKFATPQVRTIGELVKFAKVPEQQCLKILIVKGADHALVALCLRGDHTLNAVKAAKHPLVAAPLEFASDEEITKNIGCAPGSLGPVGLSMPIVADYAGAALADFVTGANQEGFHYSGVNWQRDLSEPEACDLRNIQEGDPSPSKRGRIHIRRGIEVGHIFKLGTQYSAKMNATVLNENNQPVVMTMGCYGIGVSRIVAAAIEQNHDAAGIIWPQAMAPFSLALTPIQYHQDKKVRGETDKLYDALCDNNIEVLLDDRDVRAGIMFADNDLIGIPWRVVISQRGLAQAKVELVKRRDASTELLDYTSPASVAQLIMQKIFSQ